MSNIEQSTRLNVNNDEKKESTTWQRGGWGRSLIFFLGGVLVAGLLIFLTEDEADAAVMECSHTCPPIKDKHKNAAKKWRAGETGRANGFKPANWWHNPPVAKDVFGTRIGAAMKRQAQSAAATAGMTESAALAATETPATAAAAGLMSTETLSPW